MESLKREFSDRIEWQNKLGRLHREEGPAIEYNDGNKEWWFNGLRHRENGPAIERRNDVKQWWLDGKRHRVDGPAVERANGDKSWWYNGNWYPTKETWFEALYESEKLTYLFRIENGKL